MGNKRGGNTSSVEYSKSRKRRMDKARARQEREWAAKSGPVVVTRKGDKPTT